MNLTWQICSYLVKAVAAQSICTDIFAAFSRWLQNLGGGGKGCFSISHGANKRMG